MAAEQRIPKKIYRHVLKGLQFFQIVDGSGCTMHELVSYVFLKNNRIYKPPLVHGWVQGALECFATEGLLQNDAFGNYQLHDALLPRPVDNDEHFVVHPEHGTHSHTNASSSQDSLTAEPHYRRVLKRKGTHQVLPKHRTHDHDEVPQTAKVAKTSVKYEDLPTVHQTEESFPTNWKLDDSLFPDLKFPHDEPLIISSDDD